MLGVSKMLTMTIDIRGFHPIVAGEVFLWFINHLSYSFPHQFEGLTFGGCETILFGIRTLLDLYLDWVVMQVNIKNIFNNVCWFII
jgi:hypothetical protein